METVYSKVYKKCSLFLWALKNKKQSMFSKGNSASFSILSRLLSKGTTMLWPASIHSYNSLDIPIKKTC